VTVSFKEGKGGVFTNADSTYKSGKKQSRKGGTQYPVTVPGGGRNTMAAKLRAIVCFS